MGIENGEIGAQTECEAKLGDIIVKNVNSDLTDVSDTVRNVPSENAQNCPKNLDIYEKLGINLEGNERPLSTTPPAVGTKGFPCLEELRHLEVVKSPKRLKKSPLPEPPADVTLCIHSLEESFKRNEVISPKRMEIPTPSPADVTLCIP